MSPFRDIEQQLTLAMQGDQHWLRRQFRSVQQAERAKRPFEKNLQRLTERLERSVKSREQRAALVPKITYPDDLPVVARRSEIAEAIRQHQVVILCGETGSGKSTQLPKIALELGRGIGGVIGHTQPRRIAARSIAARLAEELNCSLGQQVGYRIRFNDASGSQTLIRLMTDGILLAETQSDRFLDQYDTIIVDEAHERSLNIDFLLGYLKRLLPKRRDLRVIITSATIDAERFARHFGSDLQPAPILLVEGRTYPVELRYRPLVSDVPDSSSGARGLTAPTSAGRRSPTDDDDERDWLDGLSDAIDELAAIDSGHILAFLPTERDIREADRRLAGRRYPGDSAKLPTQIVPLFGRLSMADQTKVFSDYQHRRIVLATNVAESSLTVPGIRYVVDVGTARISRYSARSRMQRLPVEPVSQASSNQRSGRCGRVGPGICIRLYSEKDFQAREAFTPPEIQRVNLAAVILRTMNLQLGRLEDFPFLDPPRPTSVREGYKTLEELGAIAAVRRPGSGAAEQPTSDSSSDDSSDDKSSSKKSSDGTPQAPLHRGAESRDVAFGRADEYELTPMGRRMAQLPVDPRISRMILAAIDEHAVPEVMIIASALEIQDPRERPIEKQKAADEAHRQFINADSDFLTLVNLWDAWHERNRKLSGGQLKKWCQQNFLSWMRMREWVDVHRQLQDLLADSDDKAQKSAASQKDRKNDFAAIHRSLMTGLLANLGYKSAEKEYTGAGGTKLTLWPGSALASKSPKWFVAAELIETSQRFARTLARIQPEWIERLADHLVKREYSEPHWDSNAGNVMCFEKVTLWGLPIVPRRKTAYAAIDPVKSRELLIQFGLVELALLYGQTEEERESDYAEEEDQLRSGTRSRIMPGITTRSDPDSAAFRSSPVTSKAGWGQDFPFLQHNVRVLEQIRELQARTRRHDMLPTEDALFQFYDRQVPQDVSDRDRLRRWYQKIKPTNPGVLHMDVNQFVTSTEQKESHADFPGHTVIAGLKLPLSYQLVPGRDADGVTLTVPVEALAQLDQNQLSWLVPGLVEQKVTALIKSLRKDLRRFFVPAPDTAKAITAGLSFGKGNLLSLTAAALSKIAGEPIRPEDFDLTLLPDHLQMNVRVIDNAKESVAESRHIDTLRQTLLQKAETVSTGPTPEELQWHRRGFITWDFADLPASISIERAGMSLRSFPALRDAETSVELTLCQTAAEAQALTRRGLRRLVLLIDLKRVQRQVEHFPGLGPLKVQTASIKGLNVVSQLQALLVERAWLSQKETPRNAATFETWMEEGRRRIGVVVQELVQLVPAIFVQYHETRRLLETAPVTGREALIRSMQQQLTSLIHPSVLEDTPWPWLIQFPRYMTCIRTRLERLKSGGLRTELSLEEEFQKYAMRYLQRKQQLAASKRTDPMLDHYGWMLEEFRVSLFAQKLGTAVTISGRKLDEQWERIT